MDCPKNICCCNGSAAAAAASAISIYLSNNLTLDEANIIGNLFVQIGDSMLAIASINAICEPGVQPVIEPQAII